MKKVLLKQGDLFKFKQINKTKTNLDIVRHRLKHMKTGQLLYIVKIVDMKKYTEWATTKYITVSSKPYETIQIDNIDVKQNIFIYLGEATELNKIHKNHSFHSARESKFCKILLKGELYYILEVFLKNSNIERFTK